MGYVFIFLFLTQLIIFKNIFVKTNYSNIISISLYDSINSLSLVFLILYLLLTLICVVKLVKFEYGPLISRLYNNSRYNIYFLFSIFNRLKIWFLFINVSN